MIDTALVDTAHVEPFTEDELAEGRRYSMLVQRSPEDEVWIVTIPEFGDVRTHGATPTEAVEMGAELAALCLDVLHRRDEPVPAPRLFGN